MILLDAVLPFFLPAFLGWFFLLFVLIIESSLLSIYLRKKWYVKKIFITVIFSNFASTLIGYILFNFKNHFDLKNPYNILMSWIPVDTYWWQIFIDRTIIVFFITFFITIFIETPINTFVFRKEEKILKMIFGTIFINIITYSFIAISLFVFIEFKLKPKFENGFREAKERCECSDCSKDTIRSAYFVIETDISKVDSVNVEYFSKSSRFREIIKKERIKLFSYYNKKPFPGWGFSIKDYLNMKYDYIISLNISKEVRYKYKLSDLKIELVPFKSECDYVIRFYKLNGSDFEINETYPCFDPILLENPIIESINK
jgi:hypothetical protein